MTRRLFIPLFLTVLLFSPVSAFSPALEREESDLRTLLEEYAADLATLDWVYEVPLSPLCLRKKSACIDLWSKRLEEIDFSALNRPGQVDYLLLRDRIRFDARQLESDRSRNGEIVPLLPFSSEIVALAEEWTQKKYGPGQEAAARLKRIETSLETALTMPIPTRFSAIQAGRAAAITRQFLEIIREWKNFHVGYDPLFTWWIQSPVQAVEEKLDKYIARLRERSQPQGNDISGEPVGREALLDELQLAMIPYSPEELIEIGRREYEWCEAELLKAAADMGCPGDWRRALEKVKNLYEDPGRQPEFIRDQAFEAIAFLEKHDLITIPPLARDSWKIGMMSPERQKVNPFFTGGPVISVSFPHLSMAHDDKLMSLRGNNRHFSRATVHHELIPGHYLQSFMGRRHRPYRRFFETPFWLEGWPLHWEMLLWDLNFARSPEDRMGMLFWRIHRCARIVFSLNFHLGKMTARECVDFLVEKVGHERANAEGEVRRSFAGDYPPLYQCAYLVGGLQMRALYKELVGSGVLTPRQFHDRVIRENTLPVELLRAFLAEKPLAKDYQPQWKFYGDVHPAAGTTPTSLRSQKPVRSPGRGRESGS